MSTHDSVINRVSDRWRRSLGLPDATQTGPSPVLTGQNVPRPGGSSSGFLPHLAQRRQTLNPLPSGGRPNIGGIPQLNQFVSSGTGIPTAGRQGVNAGTGIPGARRGDPVSQVMNDQRLKELFDPTYKREDAPTVSGGSGNYGNTGNARLDGTYQWSDLINRAAEESGTPWQIIAAIMGIESGGDASVVSHVGAMGLMQIMPEFWQSLANNYGGDLMDPWTNIRTGAQILKSLYDQYGSWERAANAYFTGSPDPEPWRSDGISTAPQYIDMFKQNLEMLGWGGPSQAERMSGGLPATTQAASAAQFAQEVIGVPYVWGGADLNGFDCSGLVLWAYNRAGIQLPRTAAEQYNATQRIGTQDLQPGDLVFFANTSGPGITHVGIYIGNGMWVQAPREGKNVQITAMNDPYWSAHYAGAGRVG